MTSVSRPPLAAPSPWPPPSSWCFCSRSRSGISFPRGSRRNCLSTHQGGKNWGSTLTSWSTGQLQKFLFSMVHGIRFNFLHSVAFLLIVKEIMYVKLILFFRISCDYLSLDAMDVSGESHIGVEHNVYKRRWDEQSLSKASILYQILHKVHAEKKFKK